MQNRAFQHQMNCDVVIVGGDPASCVAGLDVAGQGTDFAVGRITHRQFRRGILPRSLALVRA